MISFAVLICLISTSGMIRDSCSYADEEVRTNLTAKLLHMDPSTLGYTELVSGFMKDIILKDMNFCAAEELVICDKETEKCKCGDPGKVVLLPDTPDNYVEEVDENGVLRCRWGQGSACASDDIYEAQGFGDYVNFKCRRGTRCTATHDSSDCSFETVLRYIQVNYDLSTTDIAVALHDGTICSCEPESSHTDPSTMQERSTRQYEFHNAETLQSTGAAFGVMQNLYTRK